MVLTHTGNTFCAGADLQATRPTRQALVGLLRQIVELPKPVVARVTGHVRAGGLGLLGACDIAAAGPEASTFALTEVAASGSPPPSSPCRCCPRIDPRAAARYYLTGERFDAAEAARIGLVTVAGDDVDEALVPGPGRAAPGVTAGPGRVEDSWSRLRCWRASTGTRRTSSPRSAGCSPPREAREGMTAFLERRDPAWVR